MFYNMYINSFMHINTHMSISRLTITINQAIIIILKQYNKKF
jgi:hypothetical protein